MRKDLFNRDGWHELCRRMDESLRRVRRIGLGYPPCAACLTPVPGRLSPLGLCSRCFHSIPWIREVRCPICGRGIDCGDCGRRKNAFFRLNRSAVFYNETMKEWLALWKYRGDERLEGLLAAMLTHPYHLYMREGLRFDGISYVPVSDMRIRERGFNQAERLARGLGRRTGLPVAPILERVLHTEKQSFKTRAERLSDLRTAFAARPGGWPHSPAERPARILLVDDVFTTGSTMNECARVLTEAANLEVYGLCWAR